MSAPEGWSLMDYAARIGSEQPDYMSHVGPVYWRGQEDTPRLGFEVMPHMCNPMGICHGGMMMTVLDTGLAIVLHAAMKETRFTPSISFNFDFLAPGKIGDWLETSGECIRQTSRTGFVSGMLTGPDGPVMRASGIFKITDTAIPGGFIGK